MSDSFDFVSMKYAQFKKKSILCLFSYVLFFPLISWYSSSNIQKGMFSADSQTVYYPNAKNFIRLRLQTSSYLNYMYVYNIRLKLSYFKLWILNFVMLMMTGLYLLSICNILWYKRSLYWKLKQHSFDIRVFSDVL